MKIKLQLTKECHPALLEFGESGFAQIIAGPDGEALHPAHIVQDGLLLLFNVAPGYVVIQSSGYGENIAIYRIENIEARKVEDVAELEVVAHCESIAVCESRMWDSTPPAHLLPAIIAARNRAKYPNAPQYAVLSPVR